MRNSFFLSLLILALLGGCTSKEKKPKEPTGALALPACWLSEEHGTAECAGDEPGEMAGDHAQREGSVNGD